VYTPEHFKENDKSRLEALIKQNAFATLVTTDNGESFASHLPYSLTLVEVKMVF